MRTDLTNAIMCNQWSNLKSIVYQMMVHFVEMKQALLLLSLSTAKIKVIVQHGSL